MRRSLLYTLPGLGSKLRTRKVKPWTAEEARQFLESAKRDQDPLYAAYVPILVMGLRKGEVVGLPRSAVNLDRAESDIGWQLQRVRGQLLHRETKTEASEATLPMPGICVTALRIREKDQAAAKAAAGASCVPGRAGVHDPGRYAIRTAEPEPAFRDPLRQDGRPPYHRAT